MKKINLILILFSLIGILSAQNILLWDNDNYSSFVQPGDEYYTGTEVAVGRSLLRNGLTFEETTILPGDLSQYDAVFVTLGVYCLS